MDRSSIRKYRRGLELTPYQLEEAISQEYEKTVSPEYLAKISGMPQQSVKMFDKSSRLSDPATERKIERDLQNSIPRTASIPNLNSRAREDEQQAQDVDVPPAGNGAWSNGVEDLSPIPRPYQAPSTDALVALAGAARLVPSRPGIQVAEQMLSALAQLGYSQQPKKRKKAPQAEKLAIAERRRITQERLKYGRIREDELVLQLAKDFQEKHLRLRDEERREQAARLSPRDAAKRDLRKQRELAQMYTILRKEWVLNTNQEASPGAKESEQGGSPVTWQRSKQGLLRQSLLVNPASTALKLDH